MQSFNSSKISRPFKSVKKATLVFYPADHQNKSQYHRKILLTIIRLNQPYISGSDFLLKGVKYRATILLEGSTKELT